MLRGLVHNLLRRCNSLNNKTVATIQVVVSTPGSLVAKRDSSFVEAAKIMYNDQVVEGSVETLHLIIFVFV